MSLDQTCLMLIDIQTGLFPTLDPSASAKVQYNVPRLLRAFRQAQNRVFSHPGSVSTTTASSTGPHIVHIQHHSMLVDSVLSPTAPGVRFHDCAAPMAHETVVLKHTNSAFIGTDLSSLLQEHKIERLVVAGLVTEHCVSTTVRMAANLGVIKRTGETDDTMIKRILLVRDATAAQARETWGFDAALVHEVSLATLHGEFCTVVTTNDVLNNIHTWS